MIKEDSHLQICDIKMRSNESLTIIIYQKFYVEDILLLEDKTNIKKTKIVSCFPGLPGRRESTQKHLLTTQHGMCHNGSMGGV